MALTIGTAPFSDRAAGHFDVKPPAQPLLFWEPFAKRLRVVAGGETIADSRNVIALHETGKMIQFCAPWSDVRRELMTAGEIARGGRTGSLRSWSVGNGAPVARSIDAPPEAAVALKDYVLLDLEKADAWYLEDDLGYAHPRDPYHRFDVQRSSRHVIVSAGDLLVAETRAPAMLFETSTPTRFYLPPDAVRTQLLLKSGTVSQCPYKGDGQHWHVEVEGHRIADAAWSLITPMGDALMIPRWFSFYPGKLTVEVDGERLRG